MFGKLNEWRGKCKGWQCFKKIGASNGQSANKQMDVDLVGKLKFMNKFIVKIIEAGKEVAQSAGKTLKSQENRGTF